MKFQSSKKLIAFVFVSVSAFISSACQKAQPSAVNQSAENKTTAANPETIKASSPTEAYKMLFAAVKAKDTAKIQQLLSKNTNALAASAAAQFNHSIEKQLENGMLETTMTNALPEMRDERIKDNFGAIEVFNKTTNKWDDTFFVNEDGGWKMAAGDVFKGAYKSPGKGRAQIEMDAANPMMNGDAPNANGKIPPAKTGSVKTVEVPVENAGKMPANANKKQ